MYQHATFEFSLSGISRQLVWSFLHGFPFYNTEQQSQRYVKLGEPEAHVPASLQGEARALYERSIADAWRAYGELNRRLDPVVMEILSDLWRLKDRQGKAFGRSVRREAATGVKQALIGGWQLNGIWLWQAGMPMTVGALDQGWVLDNYGANRADVVGNIHTGGGTVDEWFNTAAFAQPAFGEFGNSGRGVVRAPGINNLDLGLFKNFFIGPTTLQLRVEAFNALNHPQFSSVSRFMWLPNFGVVTGARDGRIVQLGVKLLW